MARNSMVTAVLAVVLAGCAHASAGSAGVQPEPSASIAESSLAGHWQGTAWETGAHLIQGAAPIDVRLADDGTWRGTIGKASAAGTARMRKGRLVLTGTARTPDGRHDPVSYVLGGDSTRRWGEVVATFSGRPTHAEISLQRTSS